MGLNNVSKATRLRAIEAKINQVHQIPKSGVGSRAPGRRTVCGTDRGAGTASAISHVHSTWDRVALHRGL